MTTSTLTHKTECPHCKHHISIKEAVYILNGGGVYRHVNVRLPDGTIAKMHAAQVNPRAVEIIDDRLSE